MSAKRARRGKGSVSRSGDSVHGTADGDSCEPGYVADCSGDGDCCPESWIGDDLCDGEDQEWGCDLSCFDNDGGDCDGDDNWDDESPDYSYSYSYSDNWDDKCLGQTACYPDGSPCATGEFCNFDGGSSGDCEQCSSFSESAACYTDGLPDDGAVDCHACCFPATRRRLAKKKHTPKPQTVWEGFSLHPGIPLGVVAVIMSLCAGFLKLMEKFAKTVLFGTFLAEAVFCLYLGFAGKFEAGRAFWFTIIALAIGIYVAVMHKKIAKAGDCISVASTALLSMPSLMATVYGWMAASAVLVFVLIGVAMASAGDMQFSWPGCFSEASFQSFVDEFSAQIQQAA